MPDNEENIVINKKEEEDFSVKRHKKKYDHNERLRVIHKIRDVIYDKSLYTPSDEIEIVLHFYWELLFVVWLYEADSYCHTHKIIPKNTFCVDVLFSAEEPKYVIKWLYLFEREKHVLSYFHLPAENYLHSLNRNPSLVLDQVMNSEVHQHWY